MDYDKEIKQLKDYIKVLDKKISFLMDTINKLERKQRRDITSVNNNVNKLVNHIKK
jgi:predicted  nucleic acid-binding Zn-ribbon protein